MSRITYEPRLIFPSDFDFSRECNIELEGIFDDLVIELGENLRYQIFCIDFVRLEKEVETKTREGHPYFAKPGLIVVSRVNPWVLSLAARWLQTQNFFMQLNPIPWGIKKQGIPNIVFPPDFDLVKEEEADRRGYLEGVTVQFDNHMMVPICLMIPARLRQEIIEDALNGRPFFAEPGLIVVPEIKRSIVTIAVQELYKGPFFEHLKPI